VFALLVRLLSENLLKGKSPIHSIQTMMLSAGKTIMVSGTTLAVCFVGLIFFDLILLRAIGVGCALSIVSILSVNFLFTPTLLLLFPNFFAQVRVMSCAT
jgi:uncharacterized membrane protein YdfJ with MMPL/SSD domain